MTLELPRLDPRILNLTSAVGYKGRRPIKVEAKETVSIADYWDGGSRYYFHFMNLNGFVLSDADVGFVRQAENNPYAQRVGSAKLKAGVVGVEHIIFQGKDLGLRIYYHPDDYKRFF